MLDPTERAVFPVAPYDQCKAGERGQYEQSPIGRQSKLCDRSRALLAERHKDVRSEKDHQAENENA